MFSEEILKEISDTLRRISVGRCSIALAGSHAYNASDEMSDIDIYMLIDEAKPHDEICAVISEIADGNAPVSVSYSFDAAPYGGGIDFSFSGIPVEVTVKYFSMIQERIDSCIEGRFEIIPQSWTSNGYYTYISLSEMDFIKPIYETDGFIKACKERLAEYPKPLKKSIIDTFMWRARTWIGNFHYESAIERADYMFCAPIVLHTVFDIVQVIFAINEAYYPGDKRLEANLKKLAWCPASLRDDLLFLMRSSDNKNDLKKQYEILKSIMNEIQEKIAD